MLNMLVHARNLSRNDFSGLDNRCLRLPLSLRDVADARRAAFSSTSVFLLARLGVRNASGLFSFSFSLSCSLASSESGFTVRELPEGAHLSDNAGVAEEARELNIELREFTV